MLAKTQSVQTESTLPGVTDASGALLTGEDIHIGQVEATRPGKRIPAGGDSVGNSNATIVPEAVYLHGSTSPPPANMNIDNHAEYVAGVMISTDPVRTGVATQAELFSSAFVGNVDAASEAAESAQLIATVQLGVTRAINMSFGVELVDDQILDGNALLTQFVDWSAAQHDVLYVVAGNQDSTIGFPVPTDNFNGITVAASTKETDGVYRRVAGLNSFDEDAEGDRTSTSLLAPGDDIDVTGLADVPNTVPGTSFAAPHVTATVALLVDYANERFDAEDIRWDISNARRHELMKAVLLNSADKIKDDGVIAPVGSFLGMERTVLDQDDNDWLSSEAFFDEFIPLDDQMGAGHLNVKRAVRQYSSGEYDSDSEDVPHVGWDYGNTAGEDDINKYAFAQPLLGGSYISITLAWDRLYPSQELHPTGRCKSRH